MGPVSSGYDFLTFGIMLWVSQASHSLFRASRFVESLATLTLVILPTGTHPLRSRPSPELLMWRADLCRLRDSGAVYASSPLSRDRTAAAAVLWLSDRDGAPLFVAGRRGETLDLEALGDLISHSWLGTLRSHRPLGSTGPLQHHNRGTPRGLIL